MSYNFSGHDTLELARTYGTPLYVISQDIIEERIKSLVDNFEATGIDYRISFAAKSFHTLSMCKIIDQAGLGLDTASGGELYGALEAGFDPSRIVFHGNNKSERELEEAIAADVGIIVVDSESELRRIKKIVEDTGKDVDIFLRINPGVEVHTHDMINTGIIDTKFGIPLEQTIEIAEKIDDERIHLKGLHSHIGSQIVEETPFLESSKKILKLYKELMERGYTELEEINLGGGFGIAYTKDEIDFDPETYIPKLVDGLKAQCEELDIKLPRISIEPGRYLSADAGITLYTVGTIKEIEGVRTYLSVDGGMTDNPRPALYGAEYEARICDRELTPENAKEMRISGKACENDTIIDSVELADPKEGDILAILKTGAYNLTMSSNYNKLPRPAVVLLHGDKHAPILRREEYQDLIAFDLIPEWLE